MPWHYRALLEIDVRDHHAVARDQPAVQGFAYLLLRHVVPAVESNIAFTHSVVSVSEKKNRLPLCNQVAAQCKRSTEKNGPELALGRAVTRPENLTQFHARLV